MSVSVFLLNCEHIPKLPLSQKVVLKKKKKKTPPRVKLGLTNRWLSVALNEPRIQGLFLEQFCHSCTRNVPSPEDNIFSQDIIG